MPRKEQTIPGKYVERGFPLDFVTGSDTVDPKAWVKDTLVGTGATEYLTRTNGEVGCWIFEISNRSAGGADSVILFNANLPFKCRIIKLQVIGKEVEQGVNADALVKLTDGTSDITGQVGAHTTNLSTESDYVLTANYELALNDTLKAVFAAGTDRPNCILHVFFVRVV